MEYTGQIWGIWASACIRGMCMGPHQVVIWSRWGGVGVIL